MNLTFLEIEKISISYLLISSETSQVKEGFFDLYEEMVARLYARAQDPSDNAVTTWPWKTPSDIPSV